MPIGPDPPSSTTPAIRRVWREVYLRYGGRITDCGTFNCRHIYFDPHLPWSQHAWGNAWDICGSTATLDTVARFLRSPAMSRWVANILWRVPHHFTHIHCNGRPIRVGVPPCALGRGGFGGGGPVPDRVPPQQAPLPSPQEVVALESWSSDVAAAARAWQTQGNAIAGIGRNIRRIIR